MKKVRCELWVAVEINVSDEDYAHWLISENNPNRGMIDSMLDAEAKVQKVLDTRLKSMNASVGLYEGTNPREIGDEYVE